MKSIDITSMVRKHVRRLKPYSSARDEFQGSATVFLDANENPFNTLYNRYPDPHQIALKKTIAGIKNVGLSQIFLGNGSDEPIDLLIRAFCEPGHDNVLIPEPTYSMYKISAAINAVFIKTVNLTRDFDIDVPVVEQAWDRNTKLIFLCSPNNPTGNLLSAARIETLLTKFNGLVVIDEAYIDFTEVLGFLPLLNTYNNLVVLQTLSKAWGLAGIRLGMCFASAEVIHVLNNLKMPYNISSPAQSVAMNYLQDVNGKNDRVIEIKKQRQFLTQGLSKAPIVDKVYPSDANFLLVKVKNAQITYRDLLANGIVVRDRSNAVLCENCLRITVGTELENKLLMEVFNRL